MSFRIIFSRLCDARHGTPVPTTETSRQLRPARTMIRSELPDTQRAGCAPDCWPTRGTSGKQQLLNPRQSPLSDSTVKINPKLRPSVPHSAVSFKKAVSLARLARADLRLQDRLNVWMGDGRESHGRTLVSLITICVSPRISLV